MGVGDVGCVGFRVGWGGIMAENEIKVVCICVVIMYFCAPMTTALVSLLQFADGPFFGIYSLKLSHDIMLYIMLAIVSSSKSFGG